MSLNTESEQDPQNLTTLRLIYQLDYKPSFCHFDRIYASKAEQYNVQTDFSTGLRSQPLDMICVSSQDKKIVKSQEISLSSGDLTA
jgi:hypothetical protein